MDKINLSSFAAVQGEEIYRDVAGQTVAIRRVIPYAEAMDNIQWAINIIVDDRPFISTPIQSMVTDMALLRAFTNLEIPEFEETMALYSAYDIITQNGLLDLLSLVDVDQKAFISGGIYGAAVNIVKYRNSAAGIIQGLVESSDNAESKINEMLAKLQDPEQFKEAKHFAEIYEKMTTPPVEVDLPTA